MIVQSERPSVNSEPPVERAGASRGGTAEPRRPLPSITPVCHGDPPLPNPHTARPTFTAGKSSERNAAKSARRPSGPPDPRARRTRMDRAMDERHRAPADTEPSGGCPGGAHEGLGRPSPQGRQELGCHDCARTGESQSGQPRLRAPESVALRGVEERDSPPGSDLAYAGKRRVGDDATRHSLIQGGVAPEHCPDAQRHLERKGCAHEPTARRACRYVGRSRRYCRPKATPRLKPTRLRCCGRSRGTALCFLRSDSREPSAPLRSRRSRTLSGTPQEWEPTPRSIRSTRTRRPSFL